MEEKKKKRKKKKLSVWHILGGRILKASFFARHVKMFALLVVLSFVLVASRYSCLLKTREIDYLQKELEDARLEALAISVELAGYSRHSTVEEQVKKQQLDLEVPTAPPYELYK
jgi:hypothetical protein